MPGVAIFRKTVDSLILQIYLLKLSVYIRIREDILFRHILHLILRQFGGENRS